MGGFVKPFIKWRPDKIIMDIGTNNLRTDKPQVVSEKIVNLMRVIEQQLPDTKLGVSSLIIRNDEQVLNKHW